MNIPLVVIVAIATAAALGAGLALTVRGFKASERAAGAENNGHDTADAAQAAIARNDSATIELLKRFFDGKVCAVCKRPIPPVQRTGLKPGLMDPATHETHSWNEITKGNVNLSAALETQLPVCPSCQVSESFRQRFPEHVVERDRSLQGAPH